MTMNKMFHKLTLRHIILTVIIPAIMVVTLNWQGTSAVSLAQSDSPVEDSATEPFSGLTLKIEGPDEVTVGEKVTLKVMASNVPDPGIFGYQFHLNWPASVFSLGGSSVTPNPDFPVVAKLDLSSNSLRVGASRQGDVPDLGGPIVLLSIELQANVVTAPDAASFTLTHVRLGQKGGLDVPVEQIVNLDVKIKAAANGGGISGNVKVEGRADEQQAGHVINSDTFSTVSDSKGDFSFNDIDFGVYTLTANSPGFLAATCVDVSHTAGNTLLQNSILLAGDIDDNGIVDVVDAVAIGTALGNSTAGEVVDLNSDNGVDILDLILLSVNFNQTSVGNPWVCYNNEQ